jgi:uncharacterized membrane protein YraQ (UPF0718 family)
MSDAILVGLLGGLTRAAQAAVEATPTILCGLIVAGVLRKMVGAADVRRVFGSGGWRSLVRAWALGMLLPVCSFGVLPVARELRRSGVPAGAVLAFALVAPLINPMSLLYGLTLSEPLVILCFGLGSLFVSTAAGLAWGRWFALPELLPAEADEPLPAPGLGRMAAVAAAAARELTGPVFGYWLIGLLGAGLLGAALPHGILQGTMKHDDPLSPLLMTAVAVPVYAPPMKAMMTLGLMFEHGNSVGAAFVLLILGAGVTLGTLAWVGRAYGSRRGGAWIGLVVTLTLAVAYASERPLYFAAHEEAHTHAFDSISSPFAGGYSASAALEEIRPKIAESAGPFELVALGALVLLGILGGTIRALDRLRPATSEPAAENHSTDFVVSLGVPPEEAGPTAQPVPIWNRPIPAPALGVIALLGLILFGVIGVYVYYPAPEVVFDEMTRVRAEALTAVTSHKQEIAVRQIAHWDLLTRKLQVGVLIRKGGLSDESRQAAEDLRERLEELRDALLQQRPKDAEDLVPHVEAAYRNCRQGYLGS